MIKKGSITVFFALILSIIIVLICTCIESVKMMCARTQIANGADVGMYSLFAQYDRDLLEKYNLFYVDASYGTGTLQMAQAYRTVEAYMEPILKQNYLDLSVASGGVTSYVLATDCNGQPFRDQAVAYMRDTFDSQKVQLLVDKTLEMNDEIERQQEMKRQVKAQNYMASYEEEMARAGNESAQAEAELTDEELENTPEVLVENPIDIIREIQKNGILDLVISHSQSLSQKEMDVQQLASQRELEQGIGVLPPVAVAVGDSMAEQVLFQEYVMGNCGAFLWPSNSGLEYQVEYIIGKSGNDRENLEEIANCLLGMREGVNFAFLYADSEKRTQSAALAASIGSGFLITPAQETIEMALLLCWSYAESVLEVKALFDGSRVPMTKTPQNWKLPLENLPNLLGELSVEQPAGEEQGLNYTDYLCALLFQESEDSKIMRSIDMIEADIRNHQGKEYFRMDCCLEAMEAAVDVQINRAKTYTVLHQYGYNL